MSDLFGKLRTGAEKVAFEVDKQAKLFRIKNEHNQLKHQLELCFSRLGEIAYQQYVDKTSEKDTFLSQINEVTTLLEQINEKRKEATRTQAEIFRTEVETSLEKRGLSGSEMGVVIHQPIESVVEIHKGEDDEENVPDSTGTVTPSKTEVMQSNGLDRKTCPYCNQEIPKQAKFCPKCGKRTELMI
jgi:ribosomal protein L40E